MILNYEAFRVIKPIGAVDDWPSGSAIGDCAFARKKKARGAIYRALKEKGALSINQIVKLAGTSQGGTHTVIAEWLKRGAVSFYSERVDGAARSAKYYSLSNSQTKFDFLQ